MTKKVTIEPTGAVNIGKGAWALGQIGSPVTETTNKIAYVNGNGKVVYVTRDVTDPAQWQDDVLDLDAPSLAAAVASSAPATVVKDAPAKAVAKPAKAKATAKPKADPNEVVHYATGDAKRGGNKFKADAKTHVCTGACGERLPAASFPTIAGTEFRVSECRKDRDARRAAADAK